MASALVGEASTREGRDSWNLRVTCALVSLDVLKPFCRDLRIQPSQYESIRRISRDYMRTWLDRGRKGQRNRNNPTPAAGSDWLQAVASHHGKAKARLFEALNNELAALHPGASQRLAWTELMVTISESRGRSADSSTKDWLAEFEVLSRQYLRRASDLDRRLESTSFRPRTAWDKRLLSTRFFPGRDSRFDARSWIEALLRNRLWTKFQGNLQQSLRSDQIADLVSWAKGMETLRLTSELTIPEAAADNSRT
jgi:hypothetical protein